jgi:hypothetical protein
VVECIGPSVYGFFGSCSSTGYFASISGFGFFNCDR